MPIRVRVRLFAVQRELAGTREVALEMADGDDVEAVWAALAERFPVLAPGRSSMRFARNGEYADPATAVHDGDEVAMIPPVSGGAADPARTRGSSRSARRRSRRRSSPSWPTRWHVPEDGAVVGFLGRTRSTPGTPAPGQEEEAARHAGRSVEALEYEALESMALATLDTIADEIARAVRGRAGRDRPSDRRGAARRRVASRWSRSRRTVTRRSRRPATRSTRRRRAPRSGRPSGSRTATSGSASRHGPDRRRSG